jgi:hypothetical protein
MAKKIKLPREEFVTLLRNVANFAENYTNKFGKRTGWDAEVNEEYWKLHDYLLQAKRRLFNK